MKTTNKNYSRLIGFVYLTIIACGIIAGVAVRESLIDWENPSITFANLVANKNWYRLGFFYDSLMILADVIIAILFHQLFKNKSLVLSATAMIFRLMQASVLANNLMRMLTVLGLLNQGEAAIPNIMMELELFELGYNWSSIFFAANCLLMGVLVWKSGFFPKAIGALLSLAGVGYLLNSYAHILDSVYIPITDHFMLVTSLVGEVGFCVYLLLFGRMKVE